MASSSRNPSPFSTKRRVGEVEEEWGRHPKSDAHTSEALRFSTTRSVKGVPTRVVKPAVESVFTCHSFSLDGTHLATGESNGSISVWNTSDYSCTARGINVLGNSVSALSFVGDDNSHVIAVDIDGTLREFRCISSVPVEGPSDETSERTLKQIRERNSVRADANLMLNSNPLVHQFSDDGQVLACTLHQSVPGGRIETVVDVHHLDEEEQLTSTITFKERQICVPILSSNGRSLLAPVYRRTAPTGASAKGTSKVWVVLELGSAAEEVTKVPLPGDRATWGLGDEYLLVWDMDFYEKPRLNVYDKKHIQPRNPQPLRQKTLSGGFSQWKAQMLLPKSRSANLEILVCQVSEDKRSFFVWDIISNVVTTEVSMGVKPERASIRRQESVLRPSMSEISASGDRCVPYSATFSTLVAEDAFPKFCVTRDGNWIGTFSWRQRKGTLTSLKSGAATWNFAASDLAEMDPDRMQNHTEFDPNEKHFLVFGDTAIHAFAPPYLDESVDYENHAKELRKDLNPDDENNKHELVQAYRCLSRKALVETCKTRCFTGNPFLSFPLQDLGNQGVEEILDVSLSPDGDLLALIGRRQDGSSCILTYSSTTDYLEWQEEFGDLEFPVVINGDKEDFTPEMVFAFNDHRGDDRLVLLSRGYRPSAVFGEVGSKAWHAVDLDMKQCLRISQISDTRVALLDENAVCFLNLGEQKITQRIQYRADFASLLEMTCESCEWRNGRLGNPQENFDQCISESGTEVLLAWDAGNKRSIIITPFMTMDDCEDMLRGTEGTLSSYCHLSLTGTCTTFIDIEDLRAGSLTVGFFNEREKEVTYRLQVIRKFKRDDDEKDIPQQLSQVFYGLSADGTQLITRTVDKHSISPSRTATKEHIRYFSVYAVADYISRYGDPEFRKAASVEDSLQQMYDSQGVSVFNAPTLNGMSIFQDAFVKKNQTMVDQIVSLAAMHKGELSLEWESPKGTWNNILDATMQCRTASEIKKAAKIVCSCLTPFRSSAAILKRAFKELTMNYREVVKSILDNHQLTCKACTVRVHAGFMDPKQRRENATHIGTSDTYLEWSGSADEKTLENLWKEKNASVVKKFEKDGNKSMTTAVLKFVRIEDAAKTGMFGIIRPLLLAKVPARFFEFDVVKWIITYKWVEIWRHRFRNSALIYALFLVSFSLYTIFLSTSTNASKESYVRKVEICCFLGLCWIIGLFMSIKFGRRIHTYIKDGYDQSTCRSTGLRYFLGFKWNCVDLLSFILLLVFIPIFHILSLLYDDYDEVLSAFVAIEAVLAFAKVWYFAQPLHVFGAFVRMINDVVQDCLAFLVLGLVFLLGFSLALHVLFRHVGASAMNGDPDSDEPIQLAFGTFHRSLLTLFYALIGDFEQEIYLSAGDLSWLTSLTFIAYLVTQMIVLLNFLISIMSDTFDRMKNKEEAQRLLSRAQYIDFCEAGLTEAECKQLNSRIGKYLHVLVGTESESDDEPDLWLGKLNAIEHSCRNAVSSSERRLESLIERSKTDLLMEVEMMRNMISRLHNSSHELQRNSLDRFDQTD